MFVNIVIYNVRKPESANIWITQTQKEEFHDADVFMIEKAK
jgi:hypothetical protein